MANNLEVKLVQLVNALVPARVQRIAQIAESLNDADREMERLVNRAMIVADRPAELPIDFDGRAAAIVLFTETADLLALLPIARRDEWVVLIAEAIDKVSRAGAETQAVLDRLAERFGDQLPVLAAFAQRRHGERFPSLAGLVVSAEQLEQRRKAEEERIFKYGRPRRSG